MKRQKKFNGKLYCEYYFGLTRYPDKEADDAVNKAKKLGLRYRKESNIWGNTTVWVRAK